MKKVVYISLLIILGNSMLHAQVAIGKATPVADAILDFSDTDNKGVSIPKIISLDATSVPGTFYFDTADSKVKFILDAGTMDLSVMLVPPASVYDITTNGYDTFAENSGTIGTVIGADTSAAPGALVLESTEMVLKLPKVANPHLTIIDPEPGMIVYDTTSQMLAVYNGYKWSYWGKQ